MKGNIRLASDKSRALIKLFTGRANASTFLHESAHHFLDIMQRYAEQADAPEALKADYEHIKKYLEVGEDGEIKTSQHEKFARSFERYAMEGNAPTKPMAAIFAKFKQWLTDIYKTVDRLKAPITDEIRGVFDRMLGADISQVIIAPERPFGKRLAEDHTERANITPPEHAAGVRDNIRSEIDKAAQSQAPEVYDAIKDAESSTRTESVGGETTGNTTASNAPESPG